MLDRIIPKLSRISTQERDYAVSVQQRDKWFTSLTEVNQYGFKKRTDLIITGFLNDVDPFRQCPMDLILVFVAFIGGFLEIKFDIFHPDFPNDIKDEGTMIHRKIHKNNDGVCDIIYACSNGFNAGYHEWHIKYKCKSITKQPQDDIGILSDIGDVQRYNDNKFLFLGDVYWLSNTGGDKCDIYYKKGMSVTTVKCDNFRPWIKDDVISVRLDCNKWTVEFRINNRTVGKVLKIRPRMHYLGIISRTNNVKYKLVYLPS